jgi:hypothetical protein
MFLGQGAMAYGAFLLNARAQGTSLAPKLTLREIRAVRLRAGFNSRFVRVYTDQGLTGTGEMLVAPPRHCLDNESRPCFTIIELCC